MMMNNNQASELKVTTHPNVHSNVVVSVFSVIMYDGEAYVGMGTIVARTHKVHNIMLKPDEAKVVIQDLNQEYGESPQHRMT